jgi:hypothetical protein
MDFLDALVALCRLYGFDSGASMHRLRLDRPINDRTGSLGHEIASRLR